MKQPNLPLLLLATCIASLAACSSTPRVAMDPNANPREAIDRLSAEIYEANANQYAQLAPKEFDRAVDSRNAAAEKLAKGKENIKVLKEVAAGEYSIHEVNRIGDTSKNSLENVLAARRYAVEAHAPKYEKSDFKSADSDLASLGKDVARGKSLDGDDIQKVLKKYNEAEVKARKEAEIKPIRKQFEQAKDDGAKKKTPNLYSLADAQITAAERALEVAPHDPAQYQPAVAVAQASTQKLADVLAIVRSRDASEETALTIYNQDKALQASRDELQKSKEAADQKLAAERAKLVGEQEKLKEDIVNRDQKLDEQSDTLKTLDAANQKYADRAELNNKIEAVRKKFAPNEAEVVKDGKNIVVRLKRMGFGSGKADINPDAFATLKKVDDLIAAVPAEQVTVEGHTDSSGSAAKNKQLSEQRAESVKKYLQSQGLAEELKVDAQGFGADKPLTTNKTKAGRAMNRRVDIVIQTPVTL